METQFSIRESLKTSWKLIKGENLFLLIGLILGYLVVWGLFQTISMATTKIPIVGTLVSLTAIFIALVFTLGVIRILFQIVDGDEPSFNSFTKVIPRIPAYIGASILRSLPIILPLIVVGIGLYIVRDLLSSISMLNPNDATAVVEWFKSSNISTLAMTQFGIAIFIATLPFIYLNIRWMFYPFLIVDKNANVIESLRRSWEITNGHFWHLVLYYIVYIVLLILGICAFVIGVLVVVPLVAVALVLIYRKLEKGVETVDQE